MFVDEIRLAGEEVVEFYNRRVQLLDQDEKDNFLENLFEFDLYHRIGIHFEGKAIVNFRPRAKSINLVVDDKNEVIMKLWKTWKIGHSDVPRPKNFPDSFGTVYDWLCSEIKLGYKGQRAFVAFWPVDVHFKYLHMLGEKRGANPPVSREKLRNFPFIKNFGRTIDELEIDYSKRETLIQVEERIDINCHLIGNCSDFLNAAVYW
jgi:hypothetical protein